MVDAIALATCVLAYLQGFNLVRIGSNEIQRATGTHRRKSASQSAMHRIARARTCRRSGCICTHTQGSWVYAFTVADCTTESGTQVRGDVFLNHSCRHHVNCNVEASRGEQQRHALYELQCAWTDRYPFSSIISHCSFFNVGTMAALGPHHPE